MLTIAYFAFLLLKEVYAITVQPKAYKNFCYRQFHFSFYYGNKPVFLLGLCA